MHNCVLCHNDVPDDLFWQTKPVPGGLACGHCIAELMRLLPRPKTVRDVGAQRPQVSDWVYYKVTDGYFECIIDGHDAKSCEEALDLAHGPLGAWCFIGHKGERIGHVEVITHNQFVDWIRSTH
jgi:hypothetical protein